jgi:hypothetical protein
MDEAKCSKCGKTSKADRSKPQVKTAPDTSFAPGTRQYALLNRNEPPDDSEYPFIHSLILDADAQLARIDQRISKAQKKLERLEEERAPVLGIRARSKAIVSPLRRMPPEVLGEIFSWTLPSIREEMDRGRFDMAASPWVLTRISSHWRAVSLSTPSLWSRVVVDYSQGHVPSSSYPRALIQAQFQRAKNLKIHFYGREIVSDSRPQIQMFQFLLQYSSRWEELCLGLTSEILALTAPLRDRFSSLERLWIQWDSSQSQPLTGFLGCFQTARTLIDVGILNEYRFVPISFPTHQLTRYHLDAPWREHARILRLAQNLVEAHIRVDFDDEPWPASNEPIDLSGLRRLYVSHLEILDFLKAPILEGLVFWVERDDLSDILLILEAFVDRSACLLRRLYLKGSPDSHATTHILRSLPSVIELVIGHDVSGRKAKKRVTALMTALNPSRTPSRVTDIIAPHLALLILACREENDIDYTAYFQMAKERWEAAAYALRTTKLLIQSGLQPDPETLAGLHTLQQNGLDFRFSKDRQRLWK